MRANNPNAKIKEQYAGLTEGVKWNGHIRLLEKNLDLPMRVKKPQVWAVWNDLFHEDVPFCFIDEVFTRCWAHSQHTFLVLTKRPERMKKFFDTEKAGICHNVWLGVTAENQQAADERIPVLLQTPAAVRFVSVEPMLSAVDIWRYLPQRESERVSFAIQQTMICPPRKLGWIICGGETGPGARPTEIEWIRDLKNQCVVANIPFFLKQMKINGKLVKMPKLDGRTWSQFPEASPCQL